MRGHLALAKEQSIGVSGRGIEQRHRAEGKGQGAWSRGNRVKNVRAKVVRA